MSDGMTKTERHELAALMRRREKLAKAGVDRVAAERVADFEARLAEVYDAHDDAWHEIYEQLERDVKTLNRRIADELAARGTPARFAPSAHVGWLSRGENGLAGRRAELRKVAAARIAAEVKRAKVEIERASVELQGDLVAGGLTSEEAKVFLARMPSAGELLPMLDVAEIEAESEFGR
jgi:alkylation response protein AidB-like acyl-CoA dehydrogenase